MLNRSMVGETQTPATLLDTLHLALAIADDLDETMIAIRISEAIDLCMASGMQCRTDWNEIEKSPKGLPERA